MKSRVANLADSLRLYLKITKTTQLELQHKTGVPQYQINRFLNGRIKSVTNDVEILCNYANINIDNGIMFNCDNVRLSNVLNKVWDGTDASAEVIASLLEAAIPFMKTLTKQS